MSDIHEGRFLQWKGRLKRAWGALIDYAQVEAEGNADVVSGAVQESIGVAKREAARVIER